MINDKPDPAGNRCQKSVLFAVYTLTLARGDLVFPADQWISNLLALVGNLILATIF